MVATLLALEAAVPLFLLPLNYDIAAFLYGARRLLEGAELYVDFVDPNPPLIVFLNIPVQLVAVATGLQAAIVLKAAGLVLAGAGLWLADRALPDEIATSRTVLLSAWAFVLFAMAGHDFLQREHILVIATFPYLCLAARRINGAPVSRGFAVAVGLFGFLGFALKPFYLGMWVGLEAIVALRRGPRSLLRPETLTVLLGLASYVFMIFVMTPAYLTVAVWGATYYRAYVGRVSPALLLADPRAILVYLLLLASLWQLRRRSDPLRDVLAVCLLAYLCAVVVQAKSFINHWYPVYGLSLALAVRLAAGVLTGRGHRRFRPAWLAAILVAIGLLNAFSVTRAWQANYDRDPFHLPAMRAALEETPSDASFFTLGATLRTSFPLAIEAQRTYASRFLSLWLLAGLYEGACPTPCDTFPYRDPTTMPVPERFLFDGVIRDFVTARPSLVIVDDLAPQGLDGFDYVEYFGRDPAFATAFRGYEPSARIGRYRLFVRRE